MHNLPPLGPTSNTGNVFTVRAFSMSHKRRTWSRPQLVGRIKREREREGEKEGEREGEREGGVSGRGRGGIPNMHLLLFPSQPHLPHLIRNRSSVVNVTPVTALKCPARTLVHLAQSEGQTDSIAQTTSHYHRPEYKQDKDGSGLVC